MENNKFLDPTPGTGIRDSDITHVAKQFKSAEDWIKNRDKVAEEMLQRAIAKAERFWTQGSDKNYLQHNVDASQRTSNMNVVGTPIVPDNPIIREVNASR